MSIAIAEWPRFAHRHTSPADAVRAKIASLASADTRVFSDYSLGAGERTLDHLVITPAAAFTVRLEQVEGAEVHVNNYGMTVDSIGIPCLRQAKFDAERAARVLIDRVGYEVPIRGCVVLVTAGHAPHIAYEHRPIGVSVLTARDIPRWFRGHPAVLSPAELAELWDAASTAVAARQ
jgi:hypothetical protein